MFSIPGLEKSKRKEEENISVRFIQLPSKKTLESATGTRRGRGGGREAQETLPGTEARFPGKNMSEYSVKVLACVPLKVLGCVCNRLAKKGRRMLKVGRKE